VKSLRSNVLHGNNFTDLQRTSQQQLQKCFELCCCEINCEVVAKQRTSQNFPSYSKPKLPPRTLFSACMEINGMQFPGFCVYVLLSLKDHNYYIGYTTDFARRMNEHHEGRTKSTAPRRPFIVIYCEFHRSKEDAMRREYYFKTSPGKKTLSLMLRESRSNLKAVN
jgi:putative endonuclease